jgi:thioredoxin-related protein
MLKILFALFLFVCTAFGDDLGWSHDYKKALEQAKKEKKDVYMLITSANCRWCRKFESTTLEDEVVLGRLKTKYVFLHIDRDEDFIPEHFEKQRVPRHYFVRADGGTIHSFLGYWASEDFVSYLNDVDARRIKQKKINK